MEDFLAGFQQRLHELVSWTLFSVSFFHLAICGFLFSFFCWCAVCVCPWICCHNFSSYLRGASMSCLTLVNLASIHLIRFAFKLWTNFAPCFKASPLDWKSVEPCPFNLSTWQGIQFFTPDSSVLFDRPVQFASITGLQVVSFRPFWTAIQTKKGSFFCL